MNYEKHFLTTDIPQAEKEVSHIIDLCGLIAINVHEGKIQQANQFKDDLLKSLKVITDLNKEKQTEDKIRLIVEQMEGERQMKELLRGLFRENV